MVDKSNKVRSTEIVDFHNNSTTDLDAKMDMEEEGGIGMEVGIIVPLVRYVQNMVILLCNATTIKISIKIVKGPKVLEIFHLTCIMHIQKMYSLCFPPHTRIRLLLQLMSPTRLLLLQN